jgi:hypothetical protein
MPAPQVPSAIAATAAPQSRQMLAGSSSTSLRVKRPGDILLLPLPACSPAFNPIEYVRECRRADFLSRHLCDSNDVILGACHEVWNNLIRMAGCIASMTNRSRADPAIE